MADEVSRWPVLPPLPEPRPEPTPSTPVAAMIHEAQTRPGVRICNGKECSALTACAQEAVALQCRHDQCGHPEWNRRKFACQALVPGYNVEEICAMCQPWDATKPWSEIAKKMFDAFAASSGHWRYACGEHELWGAAAGMSDSGKTFCAFVGGDRRASAVYQTKEGFV